MNRLLLHNGQTDYNETYLNNCETKPRNAQEEWRPQGSYFVASLNIYFFKRLYTVYTYNYYAYRFQGLKNPMPTLRSPNKIFLNLKDISARIKNTHIQSIKARSIATL